MATGTCVSSSFVLLLDHPWFLLEDHVLIPRPDHDHGVSPCPAAIPACPAAIPAAPLLSPLPAMSRLAPLFSRRSYCIRGNKLPSVNLEVFDRSNFIVDHFFDPLSLPLKSLIGLLPAIDQYAN
jgi:hypothetical protein